MSGDRYIDLRDRCCAEYEFYSGRDHFIIPKLHQSDICDIFLYFDMIFFYILGEYILFVRLHFTSRDFKM